MLKSCYRPTSTVVVADGIVGWSSDGSLAMLEWRRRMKGRQTNIGWTEAIWVDATQPTSPGCRSLEITWCLLCRNNTNDDSTHPDAAATLARLQCLLLNRLQHLDTDCCRSNNHIDGNCLLLLGQIELVGSYRYWSFVLGRQNINHSSCTFFLHIDLVHNGSLLRHKKFTGLWLVNKL